MSEKIPQTPEVKARLEELRRAKLAQHQAAAKASPKRPPYSERVQAKLHAAAEARDQARVFELRGNKPSAIQAQIAEAKRLEREAWEMDREDLEKAWRDGAISETVFLASQRGEEVDHETVDIPMEVRDQHGARVLHASGPLKGQPIVRCERVTRTVLKSRGGGLEEARDKGWLDPEHTGPDPVELYQLGLKYREMFEIEEGHKSNAGGEGGGGFGPKGPQLRIIEAGEFLSITRGALTPRQRRVLDLVCGEDMRCRRVASFLKAGLPATTRALRGGLAAALEAWQDAKEHKTVGHAARRAKRAARAIGRL